MDLPFPDISHKWNHTIRGLSCLVPSLGMMVVRPIHDIMYRHLVPFYGLVTVQRVDRL